MFLAVCFRVLLSFISRYEFRPSLLTIVQTNSKTGHDGL